MLALALAVQAQQTVLEVIELNYRNADQVIPILKPLLAPGGTISGMQNRIVVRTTPQNLAELHKVLDVVDAMPRKLLISVRQQSAASGTGSEAEVSGSIGNDRARVTVPGTGSNQGGTVVIRRGDDQVRGRVSQSQSAATDSSVQTLQVLEGNEAYIQVGQSVPVRSQSAQGSETVQYRDAGAGFYVRPRVSGNQVTLSISTRRDSVECPARRYRGIRAARRVARTGWNRAGKRAARQRYGVQAQRQRSGRSKGDAESGCDAVAG
jgi:type II secretory pathway component GspD/PulD (secretin)